MTYRLSMVVIFSFALLLGGCTQEEGKQEQPSEHKKLRIFGYQEYQKKELRGALNRINTILKSDETQSPEDMAQLKAIKAILEEKLGSQLPAR